MDNIKAEPSETSEVFAPEAEKQPTSLLGALNDIISEETLQSPTHSDTPLSSVSEEALKSPTLSDTLLANPSEETSQSTTLLDAPINTKETLQSPTPSEAPLGNPSEESSQTPILAGIPLRSVSEEPSKSPVLADMALRSVSEEASKSPTHSDALLANPSEDTSQLPPPSEAPPSSIPEWKKCSEEPLSRRVEIKEAAAKNAIQALKDLQATLELNVADIKPCQQWLNKIAAITAQREKPQVLVGFVGATGTGKSTLVNALLGFEDLLPCDDERACTSAIVQIKWNTYTDKDKLFSAVVDYISADEWKADLVQLYQDVNYEEELDELEEGEDDIDRYNRIDEMMSRVQTVYPNITSVDDLAKTTVDKLMAHPNVQPRLGTTLEMNFPALQSFAAAIKKFIDSSAGRGNEFAAWPLVKFCKLRVKSPLLENGIVLVDIPGNLDNDAARSSLSAAYTQKLAVTCVLSRADRAPSDKGAQDLLSKSMQRNLQLDGLFNGDGLCFIVAKTDASMKESRYLTQHPELAQELSKLLEDETRHKSKLEYLERTVANWEMEFLKFRRRRAELTEKLRILEKKGANARVVPRKRKVKSESDELDTEELDKLSKPIDIEYQKLWNSRAYARTKHDNALENFHKHNDMKQKTKSSFRNLQSIITAACINNRNIISTAALVRNYERVKDSMGESSSKTTLKVFCVSALRYLEISQTGESVKGFRSVHDTKIPRLREWLAEATLKQREESVTALLEEIDRCQQTLAGWVKDTSAVHIMSDEVRADLEEDFRAKCSEFLERCSALRATSIHGFEKLLQKNIYGILPGLEKKAYHSALQTVVKWAQPPMHWGTHKVANRKHGEHTSRGVALVVCAWNDDLANDYLMPLIPAWNATFNLKVHGIRVSYDSNCETLLKEFSSQLAASTKSICPELSAAANSLEESILQSENLLSESSVDVFKDIVESAKQAHRLVQPQIRKFMRPVYEQCAAESGAGSFARNRKAHRDFILHHGRVMFKQSSKSIIKHLTSFTESLPTRLEEGPADIISEIEDLYELMLENHSLVKVPFQDVKKNVAAMEKLQKALEKDIAALHTAWDVQLPVTVALQESAEQQIIDVDMLDIKDVEEEDKDEEANFQVSDDADLEAE